MIKSSTRRGPYVTSTLAIILLVGLFALAFVIARPFLAPLLWGVILAIATWPIFAWCRRRLGGRRTLAASVVTLGLAVVVLGPVVLAGAALSDNVTTLGDRLREAMQGGMAPPDSVARIPFVGARLSQRWTELFANGTLSDEARRMLGDVLQWMLGVAGVIGAGIAELALSVICADREPADRDHPVRLQVVRRSRQQRSDDRGSLRASPHHKDVPADRATSDRPPRSRRDARIVPVADPPEATVAPERWTPRCRLAALI